MKVVALCGRARSGKSTAAAAISEGDGVRIALADPLKAMLRVLLQDYAQVKDADRRLFWDLKEAPIPQLGYVHARHLMQTLGTEWGRKTIGSDVWAEIAVQRIEQMRRAGQTLVVVDDVRFVNEAQHLKARCGATVIRVVRPGLPPVAGGHASEREIEQIPVDWELLNTSPDTESFAVTARQMYERGISGFDQADGFR